MVPRPLLAALSSPLFVSPAAGQADRLLVRAEAPGPVRIDAPVSLSVLDGDLQGFLSPRAPAELINRAAGSFVQAGSGREHLTAIRSPVLTGGAGAGSFLFLQDGVPLRAPGFANVNGLFHAGFAFAEEVRVLRGPGDVAYGSNALHGAVEVVTPRPGEAPSSAVLSYGSFDRVRGVGVLDAETFRVGISAYSDGGYREDSGALDLKAHLAAEAGPGLLRVSLQQLEQETAGYVLGDDAYRVDGLRRSNPNPEAYRDVRHALLSYEIPIAAGGWRGSVTPYARWTDMAFKLHFFPGDALEENEHASLGVQSLAIRELAPDVELAAGLDVDLTEGSLREFQDEPTVFSFVQGLHYDYRVKAAEVAPFARIGWQASPAWRLQAGLRGTFTRYDYETDAPAGTLARYLRPADRTDEFSAVTGKLAAVYEPRDGRAFVASLARGARPPQTSELYRLDAGQDVSGIEPETIVSAELGWRERFGRGQVALTGFAMEKSDVIIRDRDGFSITGADTTHVGIEAEGSLELTQTLTLTGSGTYAEHRYGFDRPAGSASESIEDGDIIDTAPRTLATAQLAWTPDAGWLVEAAYTHVGEYPMDAANSVFYEGHDLLDLRVQRLLAKGVALTGIVRNLADARYARRADYAFGNERFFPGEERAAELVLSAKF